MKSDTISSPVKCDSMIFAEQLKALGHPVRLKLVQRLAEHSDFCCGDLCACFEHSQSTISQHLSVLVEARLVHGERRGNRMHYAIRREAFDRVQQALQQLTIPPAGTGCGGTGSDRNA